MDAFSSEGEPSRPCLERRLRLRRDRRRSPDQVHTRDQGEYTTRECFVIDVSRSITSERVVSVLEGLFEQQGPPENLRSDNGPEFVAEALKTYLADEKVKTHYIEPGAPWQNGYVESFNATFRDNLLDRELFQTMLEAKVLSEQLRRRYNEHRPHSAIGCMTPAAYAAQQNDYLNHSEPVPALT